MPILMENEDKSQIPNSNAAPRGSGARRSSSSAQLPSAGHFTRGHRGLSPCPETLVSPSFGILPLCVLPPVLRALAIGSRHSYRATAHAGNGGRTPGCPAAGSQLSQSGTSSRALPSKGVPTPPSRAARCGTAAKTEPPCSSYGTRSTKTTE